MESAYVKLALLIVFIVAGIFEFLARKTNNKNHYLASALVNLIPIMLLPFSQDSQWLLAFFIVTLFALNALSSMYRFLTMR